MGILDEEPARAPAGHVIGQDLSNLSVADLQARIAALRAEIARLETDIGAKSAHRSEAEAFFRRG